MKTKELRREEAAERQRRHDVLNLEMKLTKLDLRDGKSARERSRLGTPVKREHRRVSRGARLDAAVQRVTALTDKTEQALRDLGAAARATSTKVQRFTSEIKTTQTD